MSRHVVIVLSAAILFYGVAATAIPEFFQRASEQIEREYINPRSIDLKSWTTQLRADANALCTPSCTEQNLEKLLQGKIQSLNDPHFYLYSPMGIQGERIAGVGDPRRSSHYGFLVARLEEFAQVIYVHPGTPAAQQFKVGDVIRRVDNQALNLSSVLAKAEHEQQPIELEYEREGTRQTTTLTTATAPWSSQFDFMSNNALRIQLSTLTEGDDDAVHRALLEAKQRGVRGIILDLRVNMGGQPFATVNVAGGFLKSAGVILKDRTGQRIDYTFSNGEINYFNEASSQRVTEKFVDPQLWTGPLVVLTSNRTFSAGENLANILQAAGRAKVIGEVSLGGAGVTTNSIEIRRPTRMILPQYRHFDMAGQPRPLRVTPDIALPLDTANAALNVDNQLMEALRVLANLK